MVYIITAFLLAIQLSRIAGMPIIYGREYAGTKALAARDEDEIHFADGPFNSLFIVPGDNIELELTFNSTGPTGALEIEYQSTQTNGIAVVPNHNPSGTLPEGYIFVDPTTYLITVANSTLPSDALRIDYKFSSAVKASADVSKGVIAKLQNNAFVTTGFGELEWETDEEEWSLTVQDLNGEWAILIPSTAQL